MTEIFHADFFHVAPTNNRSMLRHQFRFLHQCKNAFWFLVFENIRKMSTRLYITVVSCNSKMRRRFSKRFLRGFRFSNVVLLKGTTFENLRKTSKRFLKDFSVSRGFSEVFRRSTFFVYFRCYFVRSPGSY